MALRLGGALALVTGGASGIGRAVCVRLAREGATVAIADCDEAGAAQTLRGLRPGDHQVLRVDVGCARSVAGLMGDIQACFSRPASVCVNCAGITMDEFLLKQTEEAFDAVLRVNLKGTFLVTQAVAKALVESGSPSGGGGGSIVNMGSIVGKVGNLGQVNYAASKAGVEAISKTAAKELARYGIRCNTVLPGFIRSPMTDKVPQKVLDKFAGMVPLGRLGDPEDVADVCAFLASDESRYITGASLEGVFSSDVSVSPDQNLSLLKLHQINAPQGQGYTLWPKRTIVGGTPSMAGRFLGWTIFNVNQI